MLLVPKQRRRRTGNFLLSFNAVVIRAKELGSSLGRLSTFEREQKVAGDEREVSAPPKKIDGIGEEAYWTSNRFGGILYVLKNDVFTSISVGGRTPRRARSINRKRCPESPQALVGNAP
jgi:hypothetical protein